MQAEKIQSIIETKLPGTQAVVKTDDNVHFSAIVIGEQFNGLSRVKQQQLVYNALNEELTSGEVHALALRTYTPDMWEKESK